MLSKIGAQITQYWTHKGPPLVSIVCITYNHESYIKDAIESFLMQETDFPFEIIIQDDASTDKTTEIVQQYAQKYPSIIKPIYNKENQYSTIGKNVFVTAVGHAIGKYIACCEGDDYWIDKKKLQIQISEMQKLPICNVSIHPAIRIDATNNKDKKIIAKHYKENKVFLTEEIILGSAKFCPMASIIFNKTVFDRIPDWFFDAPVGDYFLQILSSLNGGALYINRVMSVYRAGSSGSWSERMSHDENFAYNYFVRMLKSLEDINLHTQNKYQKEFTIIKSKISFFMAINPTLTLQKRKKIFMENKNKFDYKQKLIWYLAFQNNNITRIIFRLKNYICD